MSSFKKKCKYPPKPEELWVALIRNNNTIKLGKVPFIGNLTRDLSQTIISIINFKFKDVLITDEVVTLIVNHFKSKIQNDNITTFLYEDVRSVIISVMESIATKATVSEAIATESIATEATYSEATKATVSEATETTATNWIEVANGSIMGFNKDGNTYYCLDCKSDLERVRILPDDNIELAVCQNEDCNLSCEQVKVIWKCDKCEDVTTEHSKIAIDCQCNGHYVRHIVYDISEGCSCYCKENLTRCNLIKLHLPSGYNHEHRLVSEKADFPIEPSPMMGQLIHLINENSLHFGAAYDIRYYYDYAILAFKNGRGRHGCNAIIVKPSKFFYASGMMIYSDGRVGRVSKKQVLVVASDLEGEQELTRVSKALSPKPKPKTKTR